MTTATENKTIASESGHFYDAVTGEPRYEIENKSKPGEMRATTLRDAKKFGYKPSVTTILHATLPAPGLTEWKIRQGIMSALTLPKIAEESLDVYMDRCLEDAKEQASKAAEFGTNVHTAIERFMQGKQVEAEYEVFCISALAELEKAIPGFEIAKCDAERSFVHPVLFYGGKVDLHSRSLRFVLDFKTKSFGPDDKIRPYDENCIQLSAYQEGLILPEDTKRLNVFISTTHPGLVRIVEHDNHPKWWRVFQSLLNTWLILKWEK